MQIEDDAHKRSSARKPVPGFLVLTIPHLGSTSLPPQRVRSVLDAWLRAARAAPPCASFGNRNSETKVRCGIRKKCREKVRCGLATARKLHPLYHRERAVKARGACTQNSPSHRTQSRERPTATRHHGPTHARVSRIRYPVSRNTVPSRASDPTCPPGPHATGIPLARHRAREVIPITRAPSRRLGQRTA